MAFSIMSRFLHSADESFILSAAGLVRGMRETENDGNSTSSLILGKTATLVGVITGRSGICTAQFSNRSETSKSFLLPGGCSGISCVMDFEDRCNMRSDDSGMEQEAFTMARSITVTLSPVLFISFSPPGRRGSSRSGHTSGRGTGDRWRGSERRLSRDVILVGCLTVNVVGLRYYHGTVTNGEMVQLVREPATNPYDSNAIRVLNIRGDHGMPESWIWAWNAPDCAPVRLGIWVSIQSLLRVSAWILAAEWTIPAGVFWRWIRICCLPANVLLKVELSLSQIVQILLKLENIFFRLFSIAKTLGIHNAKLTAGFDEALRVLKRTSVGKREAIKVPGALNRNENAKLTVGFDEAIQVLEVLVTFISLHFHVNGRSSRQADAYNIDCEKTSQPVFFSEAFCSDYSSWSEAFNSPAIFFHGKRNDIIVHQEVRSLLQVSLFCREGKDKDSVYESAFFYWPLLGILQKKRIRISISGGLFRQCVEAKPAYSQIICDSDATLSAFTAPPQNISISPRDYIHRKELTPPKSKAQWYYCHFIFYTIESEAKHATSISIFQENIT
ncbi:hypothetical protein SELMODRAFT_448393 [Selaginella moellendorffii]|uniref:HIRAN domain-containing protein n=1 Tax=Selaginella moellendorffii TaxID=88036 RepID=D8T6Y9_SELML|nr:hypothetical protein SELMODRAFT_448393 [Selaginella moellendorffii]